MPKQSSMVEPEMPGSTIAEIAIIAAMNTYITKPTVMCSKSFEAPKGPFR